MSIGIEKKWPAVAPQLLTADGNTLGVVNVVDARGFKVKQLVVISATGQPDLNVQIKRFITSTKFYVGPINPTAGKALTARSDLSLYTLANGAFIYAAEQDKVTVKPDDIWQSVYAQEPANAVRSHQVDEFGQSIDSVIGLDGKVRLAVDAAVTVSGVTVNLDAFTKFPADNAIAVGTEDGTQTGIKHALKVTSDGNLNVKDTAAEASLASIDSKLVDLTTTPVKTVQIFTKPFDSITATYPSPTQEVYQSRVGGVTGSVQETVTVNYTTSTKDLILNVART